MSLCVSKTLSLSSSVKNRGIVSILNSDHDTLTNASASPLKRTLSADLSSKKLFSQNGFCPMKKISSSEEPDAAISESFSSSDEEKEYCEDEDKHNESKSRFDIWMQIQNKKKEEERTGGLDWSCILSHKERDSHDKSLPPYVHPLAKRSSSSSLSEKSLKICTESLGSETGTDGFSFYPPRDTGVGKEDKGEDQETQKKEMEEPILAPEQEFKVAKYNHLGGKKLLPQPFPPAIPSLSSQDGKSLTMRTHRDNGRLVLQAVSVQSRNNFCAKRQDGRLVLTFTKTSGNSDPEVEKNEEIDEKENNRELADLEEEFESLKEERIMEVDTKEEADEENEEMGIEREQPPKFPNGFVSVNGLIHLTNKPIMLGNRSPIWINSKKADKDEDEEEDEEEINEWEPHAPIAQSLPVQAKVARPMAPSSTVDDTVNAACFNAYPYYWRAEEFISNGSTQNPKTENKLPKDSNCLTNTNKSGRDEGMVVSWIKGCKEHRRSLLSLESFCIATS